MTKAGAFEIKDGSASKLELSKKRRELEKHAYDETGVNVRVTVIQGEFVVLKVHGLKMRRWPILGSDFETAKKKIVEFCIKQQRRE